MVDTEQWVGITDTGQPLVLADGHCPYYRPGKNRLMRGCATCWYCQWADFRKSVDITLAQSVCRCPQNRVSILSGNKNEQLQNGGKA